MRRLFVNILIGVWSVISVLPILSAAMITVDQVLNMIHTRSYHISSFWALLILLGVVILLNQFMFYAAFVNRTRFLAVSNMVLFLLVPMLIVGIPIYIGEPIPTAVGRSMFVYLFIHLSVLIGKVIPLLRHSIN